MVTNEDLLIVMAILFLDMFAIVIGMASLSYRQYKARQEIKELAQDVAYWMRGGDK